MKIKYLLLIALVVFLGCSNQPQYVSNSKKFSSFDLDNHDIEYIVKEAIKSLKKSNVVKDDGPKILVFSDIKNATKEQINVDMLSSKLFNEIVSNDLFQVTQAISGDEKLTNDAMIEKVRKLRKEEEFNQKSGVDKGRLFFPNYSLSGKITQSIKTVGDKERVDYLFFFTITDIDTGTAKWSDDLIISKVIDKKSLNQYSSLSTEQLRQKRTQSSAKKESTDDKKTDENPDKKEITQEDLDNLYQKVVDLMDQRFKKYSSKISAPIDLGSWSGFIDFSYKQTVFVADKPSGGKDQIIIPKDVILTLGPVYNYKKLLLSFGSGVGVSFASYTTKYDPALSTSDDASSIETSNGIGLIFPFFFELGYKNNDKASIYVGAEYDYGEFMDMASGYLKFNVNGFFTFKFGYAPYIKTKKVFGISPKGSELQGGYVSFGLRYN